MPKGGHSKKRIFFVNANRNLALSLAIHRSFSLQSAGFHNERSPKFDIESLPPFWTVLSSQAAFFDTSLRPRDFVQMASVRPFNYHSGLSLLLSRIILSQTCSNSKNGSSEDGEVDNRLEKYILLTSRFFSFPPISSQTEWCDMNTAWLPSTVKNGGLRIRFFRDKFIQRALPRLKLRWVEKRNVYLP